MTKPNLVYILADDMGYGDLSCLNPESKIHTHHLDRLASEGMIFRDAHASSAVCTPSRYSILTGRYNWRSRLKQGVTFGYSQPLIEAERLTVASYLKANGYSTACFGKWHLGWAWAKRGDGEDEVDYGQPIGEGPTSRGFDTFFGISASLDMPPYVYVEDDKPTAIPNAIAEGRHGMELFRAGPIAPDFRPEEVLPKLSQKVVDYIDQVDSDKPFFVYFPLPAPHTPILPTEAFRAKSGTNAYGDFCLQVDDVVGQVMAALARRGQVENTILIFSSDNGCSPYADFEALGKLGHQPSYHFRGHKADIYEGGHRIPLIVRWPETIKAGSASDETVCLSDLFATMADILRDHLPANAAEDSVSNLPLWRGEEISQPLREATVHTSVDGSLAIRQGRWKLELCAGSGGWSYPRPEETAGLAPVQLYDLEADIGERRNLHAEHPDIVMKLRDLLTDIIRRGRSTPGEAQSNDAPQHWPQLWWLS